MIRRRLVLATVLAMTTAAPAQTDGTEAGSPAAPKTRTAPAALATPATPAAATPAAAATAEQRLHKALGNHAGLVRLIPATGIDAVCDEYLEKHFGIKTIVLDTDDNEVRLLARRYDAYKRRELAASIGPDKWRRALNHAVIEAARRDLNAGRLRLVVVGTPMSADTEYWRILWNRYHIRVLPLGCIPPDEYDIELYNMLMRIEIEHRFGKDVLAKTQAEADLRCRTGVDADSLAEVDDQPQLGVR